MLVLACVPFGFLVAGVKRPRCRKSINILKSSPVFGGERWKEAVQASGGLGVSSCSCYAQTLFLCQ